MNSIHSPHNHIFGGYLSLKSDTGNIQLCLDAFAGNVIRPYFTFFEFVPLAEPVQGFCVLLLQDVQHILLLRKGLVLLGHGTFNEHTFLEHKGEPVQNKRGWPKVVNLDAVIRIAVFFFRSFARIVLFFSS